MKALNKKVTQFFIAAFALGTLVALNASLAIPGTMGVIATNMIKVVFVSNVFALFLCAIHFIIEAFKEHDKALKLLRMKEYNPKGIDVIQELVNKMLIKQNGFFIARRELISMLREDPEGRRLFFNRYESAEEKLEVLTEHLKSKGLL